MTRQPVHFRCVNSASVVVRGVLFVVLAGIIPLSAAARADVVKLKSGGELRGRIVSGGEHLTTPKSAAATAPGTNTAHDSGADAPGNNRDGVIEVETLLGSRISVPTSSVLLVVRRPLIVEEYEWRRLRLSDTAHTGRAAGTANPAGTENTADAHKTADPDKTAEAADAVAAHWELAEWCRKHNLREQRAEQLREVVRLDPQHREAHLALGHRLRNGEWLTPEQFDAQMRAEGLVKYKNRYITQQEYDLLTKSAEQREAQREWYRQIRLWVGQLTGKSAARGRAAAEKLLEIRDPAALPALVKFLGQHADPRGRRFFISVVKDISDPAIVGAVTALALHDPDSTVRSEAVDAVAEWPLPMRTVAGDAFVAALTHESNSVVRRAAAALARLERDDAAPYLISALVTVHKYQIRVPGSATPSYSFSPNGGFANPYNVPLPPDIDLALRAGQLPFGVNVERQVFPGSPEAQTRLVTVQKAVRNPSVLEALKTLTGQDYGYDIRAWQLWWSAEKNKPAVAKP